MEYIKLTNKEKRKIRNKAESTQKRLTRIENEKKLYWDNYEYLKIKPHYFRNIFLSKYYTTENIYKQDDDFKDFIKNTISIFDKKVYKFLTQDELNKIREVLIYILNNYETVLDSDSINYYNEFLKKDLSWWWTKFAWFVYMLYWTDKKWNLYYNICLDFCQKHYIDLKNEYDNLKIEDFEYWLEELWDYEYYLEYQMENLWRNFHLDENPWFKEWRFIEYVKSI